ncbi:hypothetical protein GT037_000127 [Alternaria burnsii]|uniref:Uncharacterized protein n=1 Tax=Alternaria burnsii TaxID=1187904 RepID=A0A8H7BFF5_9PLEO|nr:uncharacterized protein GT037_000127 [Alternaria burnsii]KAF7681151.1 hypothetical protein GT037_000127 [Alternaria burnsii]
MFSTTTRTNQVDEDIELAELFGGYTPFHQVNTETTSPTPVLLSVAQTRSHTSNHRLPNIQTMLSSTNKSAVVRHEEKTWFSHFIEYAPIEPLALRLEFLVMAK